MPPEESETPSVESRTAFVAWVRGAIHSAVCDDGVSPGGAVLRRLNRTEYANTMRDLLGIQINAGHALPDDGAGGEGFDNASEDFIHLAGPCRKIHGCSTIGTRARVKRSGRSTKNHCRGAQ